GIIRKQIERPSPEQVAACGRIPTTILSDMMNRAQAMYADIKPVKGGVHVAGPAVTVGCMVGDNIMSHHAIYLAEPGDILVIDGRGHVDTSIWGGVQTLAAEKQGVVGVVVDGSIRDVQEAREAKCEVFCRGVTPTGPHKGWGGSINRPIQCGGVPVMPGDIIVGDDDGVVVVPAGEADRIIEESLKRMEEEKDWVRRIEEGETAVSILGFDEKLKKLGVQYE
ncbi:MAG: hypothetical protein KJ626_16065, partial [Verrucomicrobia bacterium]|nr:hypothetical protein [Verrucomicrobiota bacterium]